jgi:imidazole glycerol-phosphate synthase subunit HisF
MLRTRIIPSLLIRNSGLVKTVRFKDPKYVGDPINTIKIFNDKEVDELVVLDISATRRGEIDYELLARMNKEAFMPLGYGGGTRTADEARRVLGIGFEKAIVNTAALDRPSLIDELSAQCGSQSVVACVDYKTDLAGRPRVFDHRRGKATALHLEDWLKECESRGAGEAIVYSRDRDGTYAGYDIKTIRKCCRSTSIPIIALGGARNVEDLRAAIEAGASAAAAGSMFVFYGPHRAVLITYPDRKTLRIGHQEKE